jgi:hypothetical protein
MLINVTTEPYRGEYRDAVVQLCSQLLRGHTSISFL